MAWNQQEPEGPNAEMFRRTSEVAEDLSAARGKAATLASGVGQVELVDAVADVASGVFVGNAETTASSEKGVAYDSDPVGQVEELLCNGATAAIARGDRLAPNASGIFVKADGKSPFWYAQAGKSCSAANERIPALWRGPTPFYAPREHVVTIDHADLTDADTSQAISLATDDDGNAFPTNACILGAFVELDTAFSGGSVSALTVAVGDAGDVDELVDEVSAFTGASGLLRSGPATDASKPFVEPAYAPIATFTSTTANLADLTAGQCKVRILYFPVAAID